MFSLEQCRKIEPEFESLTDEEILEVLNDMYGLGQLAYENRLGKGWFQKSNKVVDL